jgi:hypothetical protein
VFDGGFGVLLLLKVYKKAKIGGYIDYFMYFCKAIVRMYMIARKRKCFISKN